MGIVNMHARRHKVAGRDGGWFCSYCGNEVVCPTCEPDTVREHAATLDHVKPRACRGSNALPNLVLACAPCNERKADTHLSKPKPRVVQPGNRRERTHPIYDLLPVQRERIATTAYPCPTCGFVGGFHAYPHRAAK